MSNRPSSGRPRGGGRRRFYSKPRSCQFCGDRSIILDYKNTRLLSGFTNREGKIRPRRQTGTCAKHQRKVAQTVKQSRHMALMQFAGEKLR
ncbi:MAG: 30S ribosomal protein S18 [Chloroflexota bacterium]